MTEEQARDRVTAFIADFHAAWLRSGSVPMPSFNPFTAGPDADFDPQKWAQEQSMPDFAAWERELAALVDAHFTPGARTGAEGALSGTPDHDPAHERVVSVEVRRTRGDVHTVFPDVNHENHFVYRLAASDDGWRIDKIVRSSAPPGTPLVARADVERLLASREPDRESRPVSRELAAGMAGLFSDRFEVVALGSLTTTGVLTAHDLGWVRFDVAPFHRQVPAGTYPVEMARDADGTVIAVRVLFSDQEAATRVPAERVGTGNVVSVDAGNVAILDFAALTSCTEAQVEEICADRLEALGRSGVVLSLTGAATEAVLVSSGVGDGAYPAFWGLAADGSVTDLVVDFLVAVETVTSTVVVPWQSGPVGHPALTDVRLEVRDSADGVVFRHLTESEPTTLSEVRVLDASGLPLPGSGGGTFVQGGWSERQWRPETAVPADATIEVTLDHGYRHV